VREAGKSTVFVTHSVDEAITLGDRILVFARPGRVVQTLTAPAGMDDGERVALREKGIAALADARSTSHRS
jgi:NitT/TauT family transport system ATP-binding protein